MKNKGLIKYRVVFICLALAVVTFVAFEQVRNFGFVDFDDGKYVYENQHVLDGLTWDGVIWAFTTSHASNWHPVTWLSLMLDCQIFGNDPGPMHLVNLILHLANTLLLFVILKKMTGSLWPSAFVAALFAIHPMHVESVAWIAERKDVLSTLFWLLTMAAYTGYVKRPSAFRYTASLAMFAVGLMAKPMLVTLPFVLLLLDYWPLNRIEMPQHVTVSRRQKHKSTPVPKQRLTWHSLIIEKIPFFAIAVASSIITFLVQRSGGAVVDIDVFPLKGRLFNAAISYFQYIKKMFWPSKLAFFYPHPSAGIPAAKAAVCILLLVGLTVLFLYLARRKKYLATGWLWYIGTLIPVIGLIQVGAQAYADRYTYVPYIGLFIMIAWGVQELLSKLPHRKFILGLLAVIVLAPLGLYTHRQASYWNNSLSLFLHAVEVTSNNAIAYNNLSAAYADLGRYEESMKASQQAITIKPDYANAYSDLGIAYGGLGRYHEAIEALKQAIEIDPDHDEAYNNFGVVYNSLGRHQDAIEALDQAIKINPDNAESYNNLGVAYIGLSRHEEAVEAFKQTIAINPDHAKACNNLGIAYMSLGRSQEAVEVYQQAIRIKPDYAMAYKNLGTAYLTLKRKQEAIDNVRHACELTNFQNGAFLDIMANIYFFAGRSSDAVQTAEKLLKLANDTGQVDLKNKTEQNLNFYKQNKPPVR